MGDDSAGLRLRIADGAARIAVWGLDAPEGDRLYPALFLAITEALRASGLVPLHASLVARDGEATAFLGSSGTGKSTTLLRAVREDWSPLAEDFAWLEPDSGVVHGWDHGLSLWPGTCARFAPELAGAAWRVREDGKHFLSWADLPARRVRRAVLTRVVRLRRDGVPGHEPMSRAELVGALCESAGAPLSREGRRVLAAAAASLATRVEGVRLTLGGEGAPHA